MALLNFMSCNLEVQIVQSHQHGCSRLLIVAITGLHIPTQTMGVQFVFKLTLSTLDLCCSNPTQQSSEQKNSTEQRNNVLSWHTARMRVILTSKTWESVKSAVAVFENTFVCFSCSVTYLYRFVFSSLWNCICEDDPNRKMILNCCILITKRKKNLSLSAVKSQHLFETRKLTMALTGLKLVIWNEFRLLSAGTKDSMPWCRSFSDPAAVESIVTTEHRW